MKTRSSIWIVVGRISLAMSAICTVLPCQLRGEEPADKGKTSSLAIVGGDIITVTRGTIRGGTILIEDGKITGLGNQVEIPAGTPQIDATGQVITPGFIALDMSRVGLQASNDSNAKYVDGLDPFGDNVKLSLGVGITTGCVAIQSSGGRFGRRGNEQQVTVGEGGNPQTPATQTPALQTPALQNPALQNTGQPPAVLSYAGDGFPTTQRFPGLDPDLAELERKAQPGELDFGEIVSTCPCCGLPILPTEPITPAPPTRITPQKNAVIKMSYGTLDGMLVAENAFLDVTPGSLQGALNQKNWRDEIGKARQYLKDQAEHEQATARGEKQDPPKKPVSDELIKLVQGKIALRISADSVSDMQSLIGLAQELDYRLVISGAGESWVIPNELAEADVGVILTPRRRRDPVFGAEDRTGTWIETTRVMEETGVAFAVQTLSNSISLNGLAGRDLTSLPLEAAFAVRGGASERKALEAITIVPARMLGLEDRLGSLEVGKDADLLVLNGPPLDYRTYVEKAIVNGRVVYERDQARVLPTYQH
ncbi:MAG: amidohydrolase family protein [bacterium]|nr:amidohydrolase family protein [bacterium]